VRSRRVNGLDMVAGDAGEAAARDAPNGWLGIAETIHAMRLSPTPMLLTVVGTRIPPMWIDLATDRYFWEPPLADLPDSPGEATAHPQPIDPGNPPYPWVAWRSLDPLLWELGRHAFARNAAPWRREEARCALRRWPNLTEIPHSVEEIRMVATLANGPLTSQELALLAGVDPAAARRTMDTLSLMDALKAEGAPSAPPDALTIAGTAPSGQTGDAGDVGDRRPAPTLLGRLRERLGGGMR